ncbi:divalent-cation tolerance protein CutA [Candidatus Gottesmanbacteria bacterium]|nr:divalent-cation tolerance protein CutA [Candidatus Gottesmanbacteria bacterium]
MFAIYFLTCGSDKEAKKIASHLISLHLVVCTKRIPVSSIYPWKEKVEEANEILLTMDGRESDFEKIEKEIKKLHSYETFVLTATPITRVNSDAKNWMENELNK